MPATKKAVNAPDIIQRATADMAAWQLRRMSTTDLVDHGANLLDLIDRLHGEYNRTISELETRFTGEKVTEQIITSKGVGERKVANRYFVIPGKEMALIDTLGDQFGEWFDWEQKVSVLRGKEDHLWLICDKYGLDTDEYFKRTDVVKIRPSLRSKILTPIPAPGEEFDGEAKPAPASPADRSLIRLVSPFIRVATDVYVTIKPVEAEAVTR